jgi:chromosome segregation ATPase
MEDVRKIKQLQSQLNTLVQDADALRILISNTQKEHDLKCKAIKQLKEAIQKINDNTNIKVSEHAILRYCERVLNIDVSKIEKEILSDSVLGLIEKLGGNGTYPNNDFSVVMKNYTVTTII